MALASLFGLFVPFLLSKAFAFGCWVSGPFKIDDRVFGTVGFYRSDCPHEEEVWRGHTSFDFDEDVQLVIRADEAGPTDAHRQTFVELRSGYSDLKIAIGKALLELRDTSDGPTVESQFKAHQDALGQPRNLWDLVRLEGIRIDDATTPTPLNSSRLNLMLVYTLAWDNHHVAEVSISNSKITQASLVNG